MIARFTSSRVFPLFRLGIVFVLSAFFLTSSGVWEAVQAQSLPYLTMPAPGAMVSMSSSFKPVQFKGIQVNIENPLQFDFLIDRGESHLEGQDLKDEVRRLTKYFLTCLTVPEEDLWVNLSPYERNRIAPNMFGMTQMGRDLLEQDYLLKQMVASTTYPERELGKHFWQKIYEKAYDLYGTTDIPVNAFNKVWIVPQSAEVYAHGNSAVVVHSQLDVMMETDYLALHNNLNNAVLGLNRVHNQDRFQYSKLYTEIMKEVILPALRKEVNEGRNFAPVRQVYNAMILATWYKRHLKDSLFGQMYVGKNKVHGVDVNDINVKEKIFQQYLRAYKKRVYNYIREDYDPMTQKTVPRLYVSGGMDFRGLDYHKMGNVGGRIYQEGNVAPVLTPEDLAMASVNVAISSHNGQRFSFDKGQSATKTVGSKVLRTIIPTLALAIGLAVIPFLPAQAADSFTLTPTAMIIRVDNPQGFSGALGELRDALDKTNHEAYVNNSKLSGHMYWGKDGGAIRRALNLSPTDNLEHLRYAKHVTIKGSFSPEVLRNLPQAISSAVAMSAPIPAPARSVSAAPTPPPEPPKTVTTAVKPPTPQPPTAPAALPGAAPAQTFTPAPSRESSSPPTMAAPKPQQRAATTLPLTTTPPLGSAAPAKAAEALKGTTPPSAPAPLPGDLTRSAAPPPAAPLTSPLAPKLPTAPADTDDFHSLLTHHDQTWGNPSGNVAAAQNIEKGHGWDDFPTLAGNKQTEENKEKFQTGNNGIGINFPKLDPVTFGVVATVLFSIAAFLYTGVKTKGFGLRSTLSNVRNRRNNSARQNGQTQPASSKPRPYFSPTPSSDWGFNVGGPIEPILPTPEEAAWTKAQVQKKREARARRMQQPEQQQQSSLAESSPTVETSYPASQPSVRKINLRVMDFVNVGLSAAVGVVLGFLGMNLVVVGAAVAVTFLAFRPIYASLLWVHEFIHLLIALKQSPKNFKAIFTLRNTFGNYGVTDWLKTAFGYFTKSPGNAGVDLDFLTAQDRLQNQKAGFWLSVGAVIGVLGIAVYVGSWPISISLSLASFFLLYNSWWTDIKQPSPQGRIECGDSGVIWLNDSEKPYAQGFFPPFVSEGLVNMRTITSLRGDQGEGILTWGETEDGDIVPIIYKVMKSKRGEPVVIITHMGFEAELEYAKNKKIRPLSGAVREVITHDRFLTQGRPSRAGLQPHMGKKEVRILCYFDSEGNYHRKERTIVSIAIENGDNDYHEKHGEMLPNKEIKEFYPRKMHMEKTVYIEPDADHPEGYMDYLPSGDAPGVAVLQQWYDNQGDWWSASRFAADEIFYRTTKESMEYDSTEAEEGAMGDLFMNVFIQRRGDEPSHEGIIIRPQLQTKNKSFAQAWVTRDMIVDHPELEGQYEALEDFREDLMQALWVEAHKAQRNPKSSVVGQMLNRLQALHPETPLEHKIEDFVNMTVERFFTADIFKAAQEIDKLTRGTGQYGVRILSSKYPERGVLWTRGQSVALGENMEEGYMAYNSEHTALMSKFGTVPPLKKVLFLNSEGEGQLTETYFDHDSGTLKLRAYSPALERILTEDELKEWRMELDPNNKYFTPLIERDPNDLGNQDIADIPRAVDKIHTNWAESNKPLEDQSFVRQSADALFRKLVSRYIEHYIKNKSTIYGVMEAGLFDALNHEALKVQDRSYSDEDRLRRAQFLRAVEHDPRILNYLKSCMDNVTGDQADRIAAQIIGGATHEDELADEIRSVDSQLSATMRTILSPLVRLLIDHNRDFLLTGHGSPVTQGSGLPSKESYDSGDTDLFVSGLEDSLWLGSENLKALLNSIFPDMVIKTESSNKALQDLKANDHYKVGHRTIALVVSKSGATSPTKNLVPVLKRIVQDNVFAMTGRVDTLIGLTLGQRYYMGAPFTQRIFPTGNYYPSEVNSTSEVELWYTQIEMVLYLAERMKQIFPHQKPWKMDVSNENLRVLKAWRDTVLRKSQRITGFDERGNAIKSEEHSDIIEKADLFGNMISETPTVNLFFRSFVFGVFCFGAPMAAIAYHLGLPVTGYLGIPHFIEALADTILACTMPWWMTRAFRKWSGRLQVWGRMGPPKVVIGDIPVLNHLVEINASKRGAMAISSMDADYHGGNPQDHFGPRFLHRVRRGTILFMGLPEEPTALKSVLLTTAQANVPNDMTVGNKIWDRWFGKRFIAGPEIFTFGAGDVDRNFTDHHISIGSVETVDVDGHGARTLKPDITETMSNFHAYSFGPLYRLMAYYTFLNRAYDKSTKDALWWRIVGSFLRIFGLRRQRIHNPWETLSKTGVLSTPSPVSAPKNPLPDYYPHNFPFENDGISQERVDDRAQLTLKGGIDMNSRLMDLKVHETPGSPFIIRNRAMISAAGIETVTPDTINIVPITPGMLKAMLGQL